MVPEDRDQQLDEERAALVLERAARLDAGRLRDIGLVELREAALEAGISPAAFERALTEIEREAATAAVPPTVPATEGGGDTEGGSRRLLGPAATRALLAGVGFFLGSLPAIFGASGMASDGGFIFAFVLAFQALLYLVLRHRRDRSVVGFEIDLATIWATFTLALMMGSPRDADEIAGVMSVVWAMSGVIGGLIVWLKGRFGDGDDRPPLPGGG